MIQTVQPFVGQEAALRRLEQLYSDALAGNLAIGFVAGEPGAGKTALIEEFAGQVQDRDAAVVITRGNCNAHSGVGDPYLPFREALTQLTGDIEEEVEQGRMSEENAGRLRRLARISAQVFVESGPDLVDLLIPGGSLLARLGAKVAPDLPWSGEGEDAGATGDSEAIARTTLDQERIFEQVTAVLRNLAREQPIIVLLDDLHWADGIAQIQEYVYGYPTAGLSQDQAWLAELYLQRGDIQKGLDTIADSFARVEETHERFYEPDLYRVKGELLARVSETPDAVPDNAESVVECFQRALEIARNQKSRSLELRAAMALGRVRHERGRKADARELLQRVYSQFSDGLETCDLAEARFLLEAWS